MSRGSAFLQPRDRLERVSGEVGSGFAGGFGFFGVGLDQATDIAFGEGGDIARACRATVKEEESRDQSNRQSTGVHGLFPFGRLRYGVLPCSG